MVTSYTWLLNTYHYNCRYGFDPSWISADVDPDERCRIMEKNWTYFVGFGLPYVIILKNSSFFFGYGVFLALFPFCIMLGSVTDPSLHSTSFPLRLFYLSQQATLSMLKYIDKKTFITRDKRKAL